MKVTKLEKALQIVTALYNLDNYPTSGTRYDEAVRIAKNETHENLETRWRLANSILANRNN